jgi:Putative Flp pilus-assembly TadE/G-like
MNNKRTKQKLTLALDESGATAIVIAIVLTALSGFVALAFDISHMVMVKSELQRTADAAALAGVTGLVPYNNPGPNAMPNWVQGQAKAHTIINNAGNKADNQMFTITDGTIAYGYWLLAPPADYVQTLPTVRPLTAAYLPVPAIKVTLSRNVTLNLAPLIGVSSPKPVGATATAILPEAYSITNIPPIALDPDTVYNTDPLGNLIIDVGEQDVKPQSNKGFASWFNLSGDNSVPSVRINTPLTSAEDRLYLLPGTKATLTDFITEGETIVLPVVADIVTKGWEDIMQWAAFKVTQLDANSMHGHFVEQYFDPNVIPTGGTPSTLPSAVSASPKLVGP